MNKKNPLGILYIVIGVVLFVWVAAEFLVKAVIAAGALMLIAYGIKLYTGNPPLMVFRSMRNFQR